MVYYGLHGVLQSISLTLPYPQPYRAHSQKDTRVSESMTPRSENQFIDWNGGRQSRTRRENLFMGRDVDTRQAVIHFSRHAKFVSRVSIREVTQECYSCDKILEMQNLQNLRQFRFRDISVVIGFPSHWRWRGHGPRGRERAMPKPPPRPLPFLYGVRLSRSAFSTRSRSKRTSTRMSSGKALKLRIGSFSGTAF